METSRDDVGIAIRSAFLSKGAQQRFSLFALIVLSIFLLFFERIDAKPLNYVRSFVKDVIYRGSLAISLPSKSFSKSFQFVSDHLNLYKNYNELKKENNQLRIQMSHSDYLTLENTQLRKLIDEKETFSSNYANARVIFDKQSPYLNSFIINTGSNNNIQNGMAVLHGENFIGRIVDVNFFSSRILLVSDLNSKIPIITSPSGHHAVLSGRGKDKLTLEFLPENHQVQDGDKIYTSGKEGIFSPGIPIGKVDFSQDKISVSLFSDLSQITFVNVKLDAPDTIR